MSKKKKYGEAIKIETKAPWEVSRGHQNFRAAACTVMGDKRTKRKRTRQAQRQEWQSE
jgi:hypothetical protein